MIPIEDLITDFKSAKEKVSRLNSELQDANMERSALHQLIIARGGEHLIKTGAKPTATESEKPNSEDESSADGSQYAATIQAIPLRGQVFTVKEILQKVKAAFPDATRKAVTFNLWKLTKKNLIKAVTPGRGRREGTYTRV